MPVPRICSFTEIRAASSAGMRANLIPGIALWIFGMSIVLSYYFLESARPLFDRVTSLRETYGFLYSAISTGIFAGLIPFLYLLFAKRIVPGTVLTTGLFYLLFWSYRGVEVDAFYRFQAWLFGDDNGWKTIVSKVLFDQFVYCPVWAAPMTAACYAWRDVGFSFPRLRRRLNRRFLVFEVAVILLSTWTIWIPATAIIYSLPLPLQVPLFNLVLCFFVLLVSVLTSRESRERS